MNETIVKEILLRAKKEVFTGNVGNSLTALKGEGVDFAEIKEYDYGDDVRKINWKATAKTSEVKVNVFHVERELNIVIAFMVSGSIQFGTIRLKQEVMAELLALLSFSALKNSDRLSTLFFSNHEEGFIKPTKNLGVVEDSVKEALGIEVLGKEADFAAFCDHVNSRFKSKSLILLIGDFYGEIDLSSIAHRHEIYALIVRDRFEENPTLDGDFTLVDPSTLGEEELYLSPGIAKEYATLLKDHDEKLYTHFLEHKIVHGKIYTDDDVYIRASQILKG